MTTTDQETMRVRDLLTPSPEQRAAFIYKHIQQLKPTPWDIICFCGEALALFAAEYEYLKPAARLIISVIYTAHYHTPEVYPSSCPLPLKSSLPQSSTEAPFPAIELTMVEKKD